MPDDMKGQKFNHLYILDDVRRNGNHYYICQCDCGNIKEILAANVERGHTKSCGCVLGRSNNVAKPSLKNKTYRQALVYPPSNLKELNHIEYIFAKRWKRMIDRAFEPNVKNYSARGIEVCERWHNYFNFKEDMLESFKLHLSQYGEKDTTLDRINVNGNYEPNNCRWATRKTQSRNKQKTIYMVVDNEKLSLNDAAEKLGIDGSKLYYWKKKYNDEEVLARAKEYIKQVNHEVVYNNKKIPLHKLAEKLDISADMLRVWIFDKHYQIDEAIFHCRLSAKQDVEILYNDEKKPLSDWCLEFGLNKRIVIQRLLKGWDIEKTFFASIRNKTRMKD